MIVFSLETQLQLNLLLLHWFKGNNSWTAEASPTKINMATQIVVLHEILIVGYQTMALIFSVI